MRAFVVWLVLLAGAVSASGQDLATDHAARLAWLEPRIEALGLIGLCDSDRLELDTEDNLRAVRKAMGQADYERLIGTLTAAAERYLRAHTQLAGPRACILALHKYGPSGTAVRGLIVERR